MALVDMSGKTCLVTGATAGIGEVTAQMLAAMGAKVLLVSRDQRRGEATLARIREQIPGAEVTFFKTDLSSQAAIRALGATLRRQYDRLDVLVNNAGAIFLSRQESADGIEMTFALNHLSYFLLTNELLPLLKASPAARVVSVSSAAYKSARLKLDDLQSRQSYSAFPTYARSKLANILWTNELARRLAGSTVTANSVHPGMVATNIASNNTTWLPRLVLPLFRLVGTSPERGAETSIYVASAPEIAGVTGTYFVKKKPARLLPHARDAASASKLWAISEQLTQQPESARSQIWSRA